MQIPSRRRSLWRPTALLLAGLPLLVAAPESSQAARGKKKVALAITSLSTPLGLQGSAGAGERVLIPFSVTDRNRRYIQIDVQYGIDLNGDGEITDGTDDTPDEFVRATQEPRDARDTSRIREIRGKRIPFYRPAKVGAAHAFIWDSAADLPTARIVAGPRLLRTAQGRTVRDPLDSSALLFDEDGTGIQIRMRARRRGKKKAKTAWTYTEAFTIDNSTRPAMSLDDVFVDDFDDGRVGIDWTAFDNASEDINGNGTLELDEDRNDNGVLDAALVAAAFDYYRLEAGETVPTDRDELATLNWRPCTRADGFGDPDDGATSAPEGVGIAHTFVWGFHTDVGPGTFAEGEYIFRAVPFGESEKVGSAVYFTTPLQLPTSTE